MLIGHQTGGRLGQARGHTHVFHPLTEDRLDPIDQILGIALIALAGGFLRLVLQRTQIESALGHRHQGFAVKLTQMADHPLINPIA